MGNKSGNPISNFTFVTNNTMAVKAEGLPPAQSIAPYATSVLRIFFNFKRLEPLKVAGSASYEFKAPMTDSTTSKKMSFEADIPVSSFILPVKLSPDDFAKQLASDGTKLSLLNTTVTHNSDPKGALKKLSSLLHVELVTAR